MKVAYWRLKFISSNIVFYYRKYVYAFVNIKYINNKYIRPFCDGHVLLCPIRKEKKFKDLTETEAMEIWISVKKISQNLKKYYKTDSVHIAIQDGEDAGKYIF